MNRREAIKRAALMMGVAISPTGITTALAQIATATRAVPRHLSPRQFATASAITERLLPRTDTPGAIDVGVPRFIDLCYGVYMTPAERATFANGLQSLETNSQSKHRALFANLKPKEQDALLQTFAQESEGRTNTFLHKIRETTLLGYFTSEKVGKEVLNYDPIPGRWVPCIDVEEVQNVAWTE